MIYNPINGIKLGLQTSEIRTTWLQVAREKYNTYGFRGFYRGIGFLALRDALWGMTYFPLYTWTKNVLNDSIEERFSGQNEIGASLFSASVTTVMAFPLDSARITRQNYKKQYGIWEGLIKSITPTRHNFLSLFAGCSRTVLSITINHCSFLFLTAYFHR